MMKEKEDLEEKIKELENAIGNLGARPKVKNIQEVEVKMKAKIQDNKLKNQDQGTKLTRTIID